MICFVTLFFGNATFLSPWAIYVYLQKKKKKKKNQSLYFYLGDMPLVYRTNHFILLKHKFWNLKQKQYHNNNKKSI